MLLIPGTGDSRTVTNTGSVGSVVPGAAVPEGASVNVYGATTEILSAANNTEESWGIHILHTAATSPAAPLPDANILLQGLLGAVGRNLHQLIARNSGKHALGHEACSQRMPRVFRWVAASQFDYSLHDLRNCMWG